MTQRPRRELTVWRRGCFLLRGLHSPLDCRPSSSEPETEEKCSALFDVRLPAFANLDGRWEKDGETRAQSVFTTANLQNWTA